LSVVKTLFEEKADKQKAVPKKVILAPCSGLLDFCVLSIYN
jgi:hypothetical protein